MRATTKTVGHSRATAKPAALDSPHGPGADDIEAFGQIFVHLLHSTGRTRQQLIAAAKHDVEWSAALIMSCVLHEGPVRASVLADALQSDPSTISRRVASLVKDGLLERLADPVDGRASLLGLTPKGRAALNEHIRARNEHLARMLADWSDRDLQRFTTLLRRFAQDYERYRPNLVPGKVVASGEEP